MQNVMILYVSLKECEIIDELRYYLFPERELFTMDMSRCISPKSDTQFCDNFNVWETERSKQALLAKETVNFRFDILNFETCASLQTNESHSALLPDYWTFPTVTTEGFGMFSGRIRRKGIAL